MCLRTYPDGELVGIWEGMIAFVGINHAVFAYGHGIELDLLRDALCVPRWQLESKASAGRHQKPHQHCHHQKTPAPSAKSKSHRPRLKSID